MTNLPRRTPVDRELHAMDDEEFIAWCGRVRAARDSVPGEQVPAELQAEFHQVNRAWMARAGYARKQGEQA